MRNYSALHIFVNNEHEILATDGDHHAGDVRVNHSVSSYQENDRVLGMLQTKNLSA